MINNILRNFLTLWSRVLEKLISSQFMEPESLYPAVLVVLFITWNIGGRGLGTTGKMRQIEVT
jgi:hypothetical protein